MITTPTILVIFGATGDLMTRKIVPALWQLMRQGRLPALFSVIGVSRRELTDEAFHAQLAAIVEQYPTRTRKRSAAFDRFLAMFSYSHGLFNDQSTYVRLGQRLGILDGAWHTCANKLFYLAVPPEHYETILEQLAASGLTKPCSPQEGWTRVLIEKPFGKDLETAKQLDVLLSKLFKEIQIYRIDHYLAKEMLQGIINFRFSNNLFEGAWNNQTIERIDIHLLEKLGVEGRGSFYDGLGALKDVGQNHLLQMLALITMERPLSMSADAIRAKRADILRTLKSFTKNEVKTKTFRAQYQGYEAIAGVQPHSKTETFFRLTGSLDSPRFVGIPVTITAGKRLKTVRKDIVVTFRHPSPCLCPPGQHFRNRVVFSLEPSERITIEFWAKKPGFDKGGIEQRELNFFLYQRQATVQYVEEYSKLLYDAILGDQTLFLATEEVIAMWQFIHPIILGWGQGLVPLETYKPDTDDVLTKATTFDDGIAAAIPRDIGIIGLGKMGGNIARNLLEHHWRVVGYNRSPQATKRLESHGLIAASSLKELVDQLPIPRVIWVMVPSGKPIDELLFGRDGFAKLLVKGDMIIDGGNSYYKDSIVRARALGRFGIKFIDVGVSGGPAGARYGASLMIGGKRKDYESLMPLWFNLSAPRGFQFFEGAGAGHFVKMVHNGIEYGMMQALAEGFTILRKARYKLDLRKVAEVYNHGSVIESRLLGWLNKALMLYGLNLRGVSGSVAHTGEGEWTVKTAQAMKLKAAVIERAVKFRMESSKQPSYAGKILSALREQFGGHAAK